MNIKAYKIILGCLIVILTITSIPSIIYVAAYYKKDNQTSKELLESSKKIKNNILNKTYYKVFNNKIVEKLKEIDEKNQNIIDKEYSELEYSYRQPYVKLNPYGRTPLSALIKFKTDEKCAVKITVKEKMGG